MEVFKGRLLSLLELAALAAPLLFTAGCGSLGWAAAKPSKQGASPDMYGDIRPANSPAATGTGASSAAGATPSARPSVGTGVVVGVPR